MTDRALNGFWISGLTELDEAFSFAQDLPNDDTDPVSHGPDGLHVSEADDQFFKDTLQVAVVGPGGSLSCLTQQPSHEAISFGGPSGMVLAGALIRAGADANPGG